MYMEYGSTMLKKGHNSQPRLDIDAVAVYLIGKDVRVY